MSGNSNIKVKVGDFYIDKFRATNNIYKIVSISKSSLGCCHLLDQKGKIWHIFKNDIENRLTKLNQKTARILYSNNTKGAKS